MREVLGGANRCSQLTRQIRRRASSCVSCFYRVSHVKGLNDDAGKRLNDSYFSKGIYNFWIDQADGRLFIPSGYFLTDLLLRRNTRRGF